MAIQLILRGAPQSTNHVYSTMCRGSFPTKYLIPKGRKLKDDYIRQVREQYKGKPKTGDLKLTFIIFFDSKRKRDWDNFNKLACDAMTGLVYEDDSQIMDGRVIKNYDKVNPRIEVEIQELNGSIN